MLKKTQNAESEEYTEELDGKEREKRVDHTVWYKYSEEIMGGRTATNVRGKTIKTRVIS